MMYRRHAAQQPRRELAATHAQFSFTDAVTSAVRAMLQTVYEQAHRENRQRNRAISRARRHTTYFKAGLNGERAVMRRRRQIAAGQITQSNGLAA